MPRITRVPSYRLHKPSGQAVTTIRTTGGGRRDVYLGEYNSPDSRREYARVIAELATAATPTQVADHTATPNLTVDALILAFWRFAERHYRRADGTQTNELVEYKQLFKRVRSLYGHTRARDFGPLAMKAIREKMVEARLSRTTINNRIRRLKHVFKWATGEELIPASVYQALICVAGLQRGRTPAPEPEPVGPVAECHVQAVLPLLGDEVRGMVELQYLTGMRPAEVCAIRPVDVDTNGKVWTYRPLHHKNTHRGKGRAVAIGPKAQILLRAFMPEKPTSYFFSPCRAALKFHSDRSANRKTPLYPSHKQRNKLKRVGCPERPPAEHYTPASYARAITRAIERVNWPLMEAGVEIDLHVPHWTPNQLRHAHATAVRGRFGLEAAQVALGHERADVTQIYAEKNLALPAQVAIAMG